MFGSIFWIFWETDDSGALNTRDIQTPYKKLSILWWIIFIVCGVVGSIYAHKSLGGARGETINRDDFIGDFNKIVKYHNLLVYYKKYISSNF